MMVLVNHPHQRKDMKYTVFGMRLWCLVEVGWFAFYRTILRIPTFVFDFRTILRSESFIFIFINAACGKMIIVWQSTVLNC